MIAASDLPRFTPGGLSRPEAARYVGVSVTTFDELVRREEMPRPRRYRYARRLVWLTPELDAALRLLPVDGDVENPGVPLQRDPEDDYRGVRI